MDKIFKKLTTQELKAKYDNIVINGLPYFMVPTLIGEYQLVYLLEHLDDEYPQQIFAYTHIDTLTGNPIRFVNTSHDYVAYFTRVGVNNEEYIRFPRDWLLKGFIKFDEIKQGAKFV